MQITRIGALAAVILGAVHGLRADTPGDFTVQFTDCVESIGVGLAPTADLRALIPAEFILAGEGSLLSPLVARTSDCRGIAVDGASPKAGSIVQIGAVIVPPDFTGDIDNYTLFYDTSDAKLAHHLTKLGVNAQHVPTITYDFDQGTGQLSVAVHRPGSPTLSIDGQVVVSQVLAGSFLANWWHSVDGVRVKMATNVPQIFIGEANLVLTTNVKGPLGQLLGGSSLTFPIIQQFNTFPSATLEVRRQ